MNYFTNCIAVIVRSLLDIVYYAKGPGKPPRLVQYGPSDIGRWGFEDVIHVEVKKHTESPDEKTEDKMKLREKKEKKEEKDEEQLVQLERKTKKSKPYGRNNHVYQSRNH